jgi:hypothetical protein
MIDDHFSANGTEKVNWFIVLTEVDDVSYGFANQCGTNFVVARTCKLKLLTREPSAGHWPQLGDHPSERGSSAFVRLRPIGADNFSDAIS